MRYSSFTQDLADKVCARLSEGESLRAICKDDDMPSAVTVHKWVLDLPTFAKQYARARSIQADVLAEQCMDIADESPALIFKDVQGAEVISIDSAAVNHQRLRIDARKWFASKVAPKKYGDKLDVEHTGDVTFNVVDYARRKPDPAA